VQGPLVYLAESSGMAFGDHISSLYASGWQNLYIHLWFLGHLLLYSLVYVGWRRMADRRRTGHLRAWPVPTHPSIVGFAVALAAVTWVVRGWYPIDEWLALLWIVPAELAHFPQYVAMFVLGIMAYRGDWLRRMSTTTAMVWLGVGLASSVGLSAFVLLAGERKNDVIDTGGFNFQSAVYSGWEALICVGLSVGLVVLFRQAFERSRPVLAAMAAASYAAYIVHWLIVIGLQSAIADVRLPALVKFGIVTAGAVVLAFGIGHLSRRVPGLRVVLGTGGTPPKRPDAHLEASS
jgi:peptidoglycan/LPS O-acetylase OafA/YrhL